MPIDADHHRAINVAHWIPRSSVNGPGERFVLWLQGCPLACPGCWNPDTWSFRPRQMMTPESILALIDATSGIEGVTFSGGEPMVQATALVPLARDVKARGLTLMVYSGYELEEMQRSAMTELLAYADLIVAGRYVEAERDLTLTWRGSRNQKVHFLSDAYAPSCLDQEACIEVLLEPDGEIRITGFPPEELLRAVGQPQQ